MYPDSQELQRRKTFLSARPLKRALRSVGDGLNALKTFHPTLLAALERSCSTVMQRRWRIFCAASSFRLFERPISLSARPNLADAGLRTIAPETASSAIETCLHFVNSTCK